MERQRACAWLLLLAAAAWCGARARAQRPVCDEDEEVDFPITFIEFRKQCSARSDCGPGEYCEASPSFGNFQIEFPACADFTAEFLEDCDIPRGLLMPSPGCRRNAGIECDARYDDADNSLVSAVCRKRVGGACTQDSDCIGGWSESSDIVCTEGKCQQYGYVEECSVEGERCPGGQVCEPRDSISWSEWSSPNYACFNRAGRGEPCKSGYPMNGYACEGQNGVETDIDYKLLCVNSDGVIARNTVGTCKSYTYEIGAECNENILCGQSECVDGTCQKVEEPAGTECSVNTDCDPNTDAPERECLNGSCVFLGFRGFCFDAGDTCPEGQTCWSIPNGSGRPVCVNRAAKGEPCKSFRWGPYDAYACKPRSETGYDMFCIFGDDAKAIPGPGPGGAGGGVDGIGKCMQRVQEGEACGEDVFLLCDSGSCVDGTCQAN